ncbi:hypothetical protein Tco_1402971 [Tanacetum coccineum]
MMEPNGLMFLYFSRRDPNPVLSLHLHDQLREFIFEEPLVFCLKTSPAGSKDDTYSWWILCGVTVRPDVLLTPTAGLMLESMMGKSKKIMGGAILTLVFRVHEFWRNGFFQVSLVVTRLVVDASSSGRGYGIQDDIDSVMDDPDYGISTALGHDQLDVPLLKTVGNEGKGGVSKATNALEDRTRILSSAKVFLLYKTLPADDPDSAGGGSSNPAGSATPMVGSAASNSCDSVVVLHLFHSPPSAGGPSPSTLDPDSDVEVLCRGIIFRGLRLFCDNRFESAYFLSSVCSKHSLGSRSDGLYGRLNTVEDFFSSESERVIGDHGELFSPVIWLTVPPSYCRDVVVAGNIILDGPGSTWLTARRVRLHHCKQLWCVTQFRLLVARFTIKMDGIHFLVPVGMKMDVQEGTALFLCLHVAAGYIVSDGIVMMLGFVCFLLSSSIYAAYFVSAATQSSCLDAFFWMDSSLCDVDFVEEPVEILEREFKKLKRSRIAIVKVRWNSKRGPEFTWEREDQMKLKYPHLFSNVSS